MKYRDLVTLTLISASPVLAHPGLLAQVHLGNIHSPSASSKSAILDKSLNETIARILVEHNVPGYSLVMVRPGADVKVEYGAWGIRNEDGDPMTPETCVGLASASKAFIAAAVSLLQDDFLHGRNKTSLPAGLDEFQWNTKMKAILPNEWELMDEWASEKATVHDILAHVSGLPRHDFSYPMNGTLPDVIKRMRYLRPAFELREHWHYNNIQYMVAAHLINTYSGHLVPEFVGQRIFKALNMSSTTLDYATALSSGHLSQAFDENGRRVPNLLEDFVELGWGPGGIISNAVDLSKWLMYLLHASGDDVNGKLPWEVLSKTWEPYTFVKPPAPAPFNGTITYGTGWFQGNYRGYEGVQHAGSLPGVSSSIAFFPGLQLGVAQLSNAAGKARMNFDILWKIVDAVLEAEGRASSSSVRSASDEEGETAISMSTVEHEHLQSDAQIAPTSSNESKAHKETVDREPRVEISAFAGTYHDPGYGSMTLCAPHHHNHHNQPLSSHCATVLASFAQLNDTRTDTLYGFCTPPRLDVSAFRLVRAPGDVAEEWGNNTFAFRGTNLYPSGYGKNTSAFEMDDLQDYTTLETGQGRITFKLAPLVVDGEIVVEGFGWEGTGDYGVVPERQRKGKTIEEKADVWFTRVAA